MYQISDFDRTIWERKAMAFVTRSHRHLWGKNNEDPLAFLFTKGLKNDFIKKMHLGWNKFGQARPLKNWGYKKDSDTDKTHFLPSGIVIPYIVKRKLMSVFIYSFEKQRDDKTRIVAGSMVSGMSFEKNIQKIAVVQHPIDGLFLFQEANESMNVIIHPNPSLQIDSLFKQKIKRAKTIFAFSSQKKEHTAYRQLLPQVPAHRFFAYQSKEELLSICTS